MPWFLAGASVLGRDHALVERNRQDAVCVRVEPGGDVAVGVVCDGCGEAPRSEVGAALFAALVSGEVARLASASTEAPLEELAAEGLAHALRAVDALARASGDREAFVAAHLLATVVGFVVRGARGCAFGAGDGFVLAGGRVIELGEPGDAGPAYPAYALVGLGHPSTRFQAFEAAPGARVAVATDGVRPDVLDEACDVAPRGNAALARFLRVKARELGFHDDASVACGVLQG